MENPFWTWCVRSRDSAYAVNEKFDGPDSMSAGPCWCFNRMGQADVELPDGRNVYIAGEHEDHYDPDFYIYNDVVLIDGDKIQILGYPERDFPPTDFHSATLVTPDIFLIGNLGYPDDRILDSTQVMRLEVGTWQISHVPTTGAGPGWIHNHTAEYFDSEKAIIVTGGNVADERILENFDDYRLCLKSLTWTRLTDRRWGRWVLEREDGRASRLWEIRTASWTRDIGTRMEDDLQEALADLPSDLVAELTSTPSDEQFAQLDTLYQSPFSDDIAVEDDDLPRRYRLVIDGTTVRFDEDSYDIVVTVEGQLPATTIDVILSNLRKRLSDIENTHFTVTRIDA